MDGSPVDRAGDPLGNYRTDGTGNGSTDSQENRVKPWLLKSWCNVEVTPEFLARLKDILELYAQPFDPTRPTVCFDEQLVQLLADVRPARSVQPGRARRQDYEYVRCGTRNVFMLAEPKAGKRQVLVTRRRTKEDWAKAIRYLLDELYPAVTLIDLVYDNLNTHTPDTLIEIFGKAEADRLLARLVLHPTPLHASWVNMAEITQRDDQSVLGSPYSGCVDLDHRIDRVGDGSE